MFTAIVVRPLYNVLIALYNVVGDLGVAIILLTVLIRIILYPLSRSALKSQVAMQELQPKLKELQEKHKGDREGAARATMTMYRENKVNPLSSCLPVLIQLPFLIGLFIALRSAVDGTAFDLLYQFVEHPGTLRTVAFGFLALGKPSIALAVLAGAAQWWASKMLIARQPPPRAATRGGKDENMLALMNKQMTIMMPLMTVVFGATLPAGLSLYWLVTTLLQGVQQQLMFRAHKPPAAAFTPAA